MAKKKIIPIFIPQGGCKNQCIFCNQFGITGVDKIPDEAGLEQLMPQGGTDFELAFYGGTFTALPRKIMIAYLKFAQKMYETHRIGSLRISTHPGALDEEMMMLLKEYGVTTIELGIQSMDDEVLRRAGRGHNNADNRYAMFLVKNNGFSLGVQLMTGLPCDSKVKIFKGLSEILTYSPSMVRIYPLLVLEDTPLAKSYREGRYKPMPLDTAVDLVSDIYGFFRYYEIPVIRMGLQPTEDLNTDSSFLLGGPFHPSFGHLVKSNLKLKQIQQLLENISHNVTLLCPKEDLPLVFGEHRDNIRLLEKDRKIRVSGRLKESGTIAVAPYQKESTPKILCSLREKEFLAQYLTERIECI